MLCRHFLKGFEKSMVALIWNGCTPFPLMMQSKVFLHSHKLGAFNLHACHSLSFEILFPCGTQAFLNISIFSEEIYYHYGQLSGAHKILCRLRIFFGFFTVNMGRCIFLCVQRVSSECSRTGPQKCGVHSPSHAPPACISCKLKDTVLETSFEFMNS